MCNVTTNVYAKFRCAPLRIKKALGIFRELITTITSYNNNNYYYSSVLGPAFRVQKVHPFIIAITFLTVNQFHTYYYQQLRT